VVRLVDEQNGVHYRPAEARRWNRTYVMVALVHPETGRRCDTLAWLRAEDVYRVLHAEDARRA
jgi:outer membrane phospholipase A